MAREIDSGFVEGSRGKFCKSYVLDAVGEKLFGGKDCQLLITFCARQQVIMAGRKHQNDALSPENVRTAKTEAGRKGENSMLTFCITERTILPHTI
jgi:hypothetical protein